VTIDQIAAANPHLTSLLQRDPSAANVPLPQPMDITLPPPSAPPAAPSPDAAPAPRAPAVPVIHAPATTIPRRPSNLAQAAGLSDIGQSPPPPTVPVPPSSAAAPRGVTAAPPAIAPASAAPPPPVAPRGVPGPRPFDELWRDRVPGAAPVSAVYTVQPRQTLDDIARFHRVDADELARFNGIDPAQPLRPGTRLRIPEPRGERRSGLDLPDGARMGLHADGSLGWFVRGDDGRHYAVVRQPALTGARPGRDENGRPGHFIEDPERPGKFLAVG
jgi:hypothetical protein